jgi:hypothetical protein
MRIGREEQQTGVGTKQTNKKKRCSAGYVPLVMHNET